MQDSHGEKKVKHVKVLERVYEPRRLRKAWQQIKQNAGAAGIDRNHLRHKLTKHDTIRKDSSINREMSCLHHLFDKAREWDMTEESPFNQGKSLMLKENNKRERFLNEDEIERLLNNCPPHLNQIVVCALNSGMRQGEILSLKRSQIRNGFIYLTKTNEARQIPINDDLALMFKQIKAE